jgi:hypothetical protein
MPFKILNGALVLLLLVPSYSHDQTTAKLASVHIRVVGHIGQDIGEPHIALFKLKDNDKDYASRFYHSSASGLPFGVYHLELWSKGNITAEREVRVFQPDVWIVVGLVFSVEGGPLPWQLSGSVKGYDIAKGPVFIKLLGVYPDGVMDTRAGDSGDFSILGIIQGRYVLVTLQDGHVLDVRSVYVPSDCPVVIDLKPDSQHQNQPGDCQPPPNDLSIHDSGGGLGVPAPSRPQLTSPRKR